MLATLTSTNWFVTKEVLDPEADSFSFSEELNLTSKHEQQKLSFFLFFFFSVL